MTSVAEPSTPTMQEMTSEEPGTPTLSVIVAEPLPSATTLSASTSASTHTRPAGSPRTSAPSLAVSASPCQSSSTFSALHAAMSPHPLNRPPLHSLAVTEVRQQHSPSASPVLHRKTPPVSPVLSSALSLSAASPLPEPLLTTSRSLTHSTSHPMQLTYKEFLEQQEHEQGLRHASTPHPIPSTQHTPDAVNVFNPHSVNTLHTVITKEPSSSRERLQHWKHRAHRLHTGSSDKLDQLTDSHQEDKENRPDIKQQQQQQQQPQQALQPPPSHKAEEEEEDELQPGSVRKASASTSASEHKQTDESKYASRGHQQHLYPPPPKYVSEESSEFEESADEQQEDEDDDDAWFVSSSPDGRDSLPHIDTNTSTPHGPSGQSTPNYSPPPYTSVPTTSIQTQTQPYHPPRSNLTNPPSPDTAFSTLSSYTSLDSTPLFPPLPSIPLWASLEHVALLHRQGSCTPPMLLEIIAPASSLSPASAHNSVVSPLTTSTSSSTSDDRSHFRLLLPQLNSTQQEDVLCCRKKSKEHKWRFSLDMNKLTKRNNKAYIGKMKLRSNTDKNVEVFLVSLPNGTPVAEIMIESTIGKHTIWVELLNEYLNKVEVGRKGRMMHGFYQRYSSPMIILRVEASSRNVLICDKVLANGLSAVTGAVAGLQLQSAVGQQQQHHQHQLSSQQQQQEYNTNVPPLTHGSSTPVGISNTQLQQAIHHPSTRGASASTILPPLAAGAPAVRAGVGPQPSAHLLDDHKYLLSVDYPLSLFVGFAIVCAAESVQMMKQEQDQNKGKHK